MESVRGRGPSGGGEAVGNPAARGAGRGEAPVAEQLGPGIRRGVPLAAPLITNDQSDMGGWY